MNLPLLFKTSAKTGLIGRISKIQGVQCLFYSQESVLIVYTELVVIE
jgi:hypothetical protein